MRENTVPSDVYTEKSKYIFRLKFVTFFLVPNSLCNLPSSFSPHLNPSCKRGLKLTHRSGLKLNLDSFKLPPAQDWLLNQTTKRKGQHDMLRICAILTSEFAMHLKSHLKQ